MKLLPFLFFFFFVQSVYSQNGDSIVRFWNGIYQKLDLREYRGCKFELTADIRVLPTDSLSKAYLLLSVQNKKGMQISNFDTDVEGFKNNGWNSYSLQGKINNSGDQVTIGGLYENRGSYCFDNFKLRVQDKKGIWFQIPIANPDFSDSLNHWLEYDHVKGFKLSTKNNPEDNNFYLYVDGSNHFSYGNNPENGRFTEVNGIRLYYETYGTGFPLILLHGNSQSIKDFNKQIPILSKHFKVIALDTRGHGKSTANDEQLSYELFASDVEALVAYLKLDSINILGWSDGGNTGLILAMNENIRIHKLAVMGSNLYNKRSSVKPLINVFIKMKSKKLKKEHQEESFNYKLVQLLLNEPNISPEDLHKIICPTLVMAGSNDVIKEKHTKLIKKNIVNSELVIIEKANHFAPQHRSKRFNEIVLNFFLKEP
jgi:pimeloyl-ACP methyl ester carboxylesterase